MFIPIREAITWDLKFTQPKPILSYNIIRMSNQTHLLVLASLEVPECNNTKNFVKTLCVCKWVKFTLHNLVFLLVLE